jgi:chemotaxis protein MotB
MADTVRPIIVIKKKGGHGGHHGGAWKVAYADFVTAMMALFIVLWLMSSNKPVKEAVAGYFKDPSGTTKLAGGNGKGPGQTAGEGATNSVTVSKENMSKLKDDLQGAIHRIQDLNKMGNQIEMTVTSEGLRIELLESAQSTFFDSGSPELNASGQETLIALAKELGGVPNRISIEGHTDSKPLVRHGGEYGNWELSVDRANSARRLMQEHGLRADQVTQVRGYADQHLRKPDAPDDPSNRRISILVQYIDPDRSPDPAKTTAKDPAKISAQNPVKPPA